MNDKQRAIAIFNGMLHDLKCSHKIQDIKEGHNGALLTVAEYEPIDGILIGWSDINGNERWGDIVENSVKLAELRETLERRE